MLAFGNMFGRQRQGIEFSQLAALEGASAYRPFDMTPAQAGSRQ